MQSRILLVVATVTETKVKRLSITCPKDIHMYSSDKYGHAHEHSAFSNSPSFKEDPSCATCFHKTVMTAALFQFFLA